MLVPCCIMLWVLFTVQSLCVAHCGKWTWHRCPVTSAVSGKKALYLISYTVSWPRAAFCLYYSGTICVCPCVCACAHQWLLTICIFKHLSVLLVISERDYSDSESDYGIRDKVVVDEYNGTTCSWKLLLILCGLFAFNTAAKTN